MSKPRAQGQLRIDAQKDRIIAQAQPHGWVATSREPLMLTRGDKQIMVKFNSAGIPSGVFWMNGDEFGSMPASGYVNLSTLTTWIESDYR